MRQLPDYLDIFQHLPTACLVLSRDGAIHRLNAQAATLLGIAGPAPANLLLGAFVTPGLQPSLAAFLDRVFAQSWVQTCELAFSTAAGEAQMRLEAAALEGGQWCNVVLIDITDFKRAEEALRSTEEKYRKLYESMIDPVVSTDMEGNILESNQAFTDMVGYSAEELISMTYRDLTPAKWHCFEEKIVQAQILPEGHSQVYQKEYQKKDGTVFPVELRTMLIRNKDGRPAGMWATVRDISARKRAEAALRESEQRYRGFLEDQTDIICRYKADHTMVYVNDTFCRLFGKPREAWLGHKWHPAALPEDLGLIIGRLESLSPDNPVVTIENRIVTSDGSERWGQFVNRAFFDEEGQLLEIQAVGRDITERKQAENALRESEEHYRALVEASSQIVWRCDPEGNVLEVSQGWFDLTGQTEDEIHGKQWMAAIHPEDQAQAEEVRQQAFRRGEPYRTEFRVRARFGGYRWLRGIGVPIFDSDGRIKEWVGASSDVTETKRIGDALRQSQAWLTTLTESVPVMLWAADADGVVDYASQAYFDFTGLPVESLKSGEWVKMIHPDDRERIVSTWRHGVEVGEAPSVEYRVLRYDGSFRWFKGQAKPSRDEAGRINRWFGSIVDIEELKQMEAELVERDRRKDEFLAMLAHELQNPLAPILIASQLLEARGMDDAKLADWAVSAIRHEARHLSQLVSELLDVARVTQGKITLKKERFDLGSMVKQVVEIHRLLISEGGQALAYSVPLDPVMVEADQTRIEQVLGNLLNNAMKYTPAEGSITVSLEVEGESAALRVRDSGVGISKIHLGQIFGLFSQIESTLDRADGGLGVGLALAKKLIEQHGGSIHAFSEGEGHGSEFVVRLPMHDLETASGPAPMPEVKSADNNLPCVLVADDNETVRTAMVWLVEMMGYEVLEAKDGREALEIAKSRPLHAILLDIGLPGMDGYEVARQLRLEPGLQGLKLVAVTGYSQARDRRASLAAGFDHHLAKPLDHEELEKILAT